MKKILYLLILISLSSCLHSQEQDSISDFNTLIGKKYSDYEEIGSPNSFNNYFIDSEHGFGISGFRYKNAVIFTLELNVGMKGRKAISKIVDLIYAPDNCYFVSTNCYKLVNGKDTIGDEYIVFKKMDTVLKDKVLAIYKANKVTSKFELMNSDCFTDCLIFNEVSKFNIFKSKDGYTVNYFE
ncbi:MAG: hypothetical protein PHT07_03160 [Paludibacter sp.]|nr:hypothetical protein [Paludibacter sp.]